MESVWCYFSIIHFSCSVVTPLFYLPLLPMGNPPDTSFPSDSVNSRRYTADSSFSFVVLQRILIPIVIPYGPSERFPGCRRGPRRHSAGPRFFPKCSFLFLSILTGFKCRFMSQFQRIYNDRRKLLRRISKSRRNH